MYLNIRKAIYDKYIVNVIQNGEKLKPFLWSQEWGKGAHSFHSYNIVLEFLARAMRQEEEIKGIQIGKEEVKQMTWSYT
jgi:hypothetical protein